MDKQSKKEMRQAYREKPVEGGVYAIINDKTGTRMLFATAELQGSLNRFDFFVQQNMPPHPLLKQEWEKEGPAAFRIEIVEKLTKKPEQTEQEFKQELEDLREMLSMQPCGCG